MTSLQVQSFKLLLLLITVIELHADTPYRLCVTGNAITACNNAHQHEGTKYGLNFTCVPARDRVECLKKIQEQEADFTFVEPEDMFVAARMPNHNFVVIKEIRTVDEPHEDHRYLAVSIIHTNSTIRKLQDLRGKKSCHTGVGRTVGYKIPVTKLSQLGVIDPLTSEEDLTPREFELRALSRAFSQACIVGDWAPDAETNLKFKRSYSNLCDLCQEPAKCNYPDKYSGYDGALRCLARGGGDVAWTKQIVVRVFFGFVEGSSAQANPDYFSYLCPDGTRQPVRSEISGPICSWAARPWTGYIARTDIDNINKLQSQILSTESLTENAQKALGLTSSTIAVDRMPISPQDFLANSNYIDVIERNVGSSSPLRICVRSNEEEHKCEGLAAVAYSRDVRPRFTCVRRESTTTCMEALKNRQADVLTLAADEAYIASRQYSIHAVMSENITGSEADYYSVAVTTRNSKQILKPSSDAIRPRSCHPQFDDISGWKIPLGVLIQNGVIGPAHDCPIGISAAGFFSGGSCVPGALADPIDGNPHILCDRCVKNAPGDSSACPASDEEDYFGEKGALRCLATGSGDVAFLRASTFAKYADGASNENWASRLKSEDYKLLCPDGSTASVSEYRNCHLGQIPSRVVVMSNYEDESRVESLRMAFLSLSKTLSSRPDIFNLFGPFEGQDNVMFTNNAKGLLILDPDLPVQRKFNTLMDHFHSACPE